MDSAPGTLRLAVWLLLAQAVAVAGLVIFLVYQEVTETGTAAGNARGAILVIVYAAVMAGVLGLLAWSLHRRQRWARGPAIVLELLLLPIGYYMVAGGVAWLGLPTMALGLVGAGALLAPATRSALGIQ
jgi:hypothetical protein